MKRNVVTIAVSFLLTLAIFVLMDGLFLSKRAEASELKWVGCGITKKAFMKELAAAYEKKTATKIIIKGGGATKGIRTVAGGVADLPLCQDRCRLKK